MPRISQIAGDHRSPVASTLVVAGRMLLCDNRPRGVAMGTKNPQETPGVVEQLHQVIHDSGKSLNQISEASGVDRGRISWFMRGEREINYTAFEHLCQALGL